MKNKYKKLYENARVVFRDECQAELTDDDEYGTKLFPCLKTKQTKDGKKFVVMFNDRVEVILSLYDMAMTYGINTGVAIAYYILYYECVSLAEYDHAEFFLAKFTEEVRELKLREVMTDNDHKSNDFIPVQVLYTLLHEISHEFYHQDEAIHDMATATTKKILQSLKGPYTELFTDENFEKALDRGDVKNFIKSQIPEGSTEEEIRSIVEQYVSVYRYLSDMSAYIDQLLVDEDQQFLDEMTCDRYAFLIFLRWIKKQKLTPSTTATLHQVLYIAFSAMDNVKVLQTFCNPPKEEKVMPYDPRQIVIRHRALLTNDLFYLKQTYKDVQKTYEALDGNLDKLMMSALGTMRQYEPQICEMQGRRNELKKVSRSRIASMNSAMQEIADALVKESSEQSVIQAIPMDPKNFIDDDSIFCKLLTYFKVKLQGAFRKR